MNKRQFDRLTALNTLNGKRNLMRTIEENEGKSIRYWLLRDECHAITKRYPSLT